MEHSLVGLHVPQALKGQGERSYTRLQPNAELPAKMSVEAPSGWHFSRRDLRDISLGGASFSLNFWESRSVRVGETVILTLDLPNGTVSLSGRCVHLSGPPSWWSRRHVGFQFSLDAKYGRSATKLRDYLLKLRAGRNQKNKVDDRATASPR